MQSALTFYCNCSLHSSDIFSFPNSTNYKQNSQEHKVNRALILASALAHRRTEVPPCPTHILTCFLFLTLFTRTCRWSWKKALNDCLRFKRKWQLRSRLSVGPHGLFLTCFKARVIITLCFHFHCNHLDERFASCPFMPPSIEMTASQRSHFFLGFSLQELCRALYQNCKSRRPFRGYDTVFCSCARAFLSFQQRCHSVKFQLLALCVLHDDCCYSHVLDNFYFCLGCNNSFAPGSSGEHKASARLHC